MSSYSTEPQATGNLLPYSFYVGSHGFYDAHTGSAAAYAMPKGLREDAHEARTRAYGVWEGEAEQVAIYELRLPDDAAAQRIAYAVAVATGNDAVMVIRAVNPGERDAAMSSVRRFMVDVEYVTEGNRTLIAGEGSPTLIAGVGDSEGYRYVPSVKGWTVAFLVHSDATVSAVL